MSLTQHVIVSYTNVFNTLLLSFIVPRTKTLDLSALLGEGSKAATATQSQCLMLTNWLLQGQRHLNGSLKQFL